MAKPVKSAKGQLVDFDLLKIKQQIASAPKPTNVQAREAFIDQKFKRRIKKLKRDTVDLTAPVIEDPSDPPQE
jgi:hypothetical protein